MVFDDPLFFNKLSFDMLCKNGIDSSATGGASLMRSRLLAFSTNHPRTCRFFLRTFAGVLPHRWIFSQMVSRCGGRIPSTFRMGNGMKIRGFLGDLVCYQIATQGWYEPEMVDAIRKALRPETVFFDVGAHIGQYSLMAAEECHAVHSFEANHLTFGALRHNVISNKLGNVTVNQCAVCDRAGTAEFYESPGDNPGASSLYGKGEKVTIRTISLDSYAAEIGDRPIVIKIDVEGAELQVLRGAKKLLSRNDVVVFAELIESLQNRAGSSREEVLKFFRELNYSVVNSADGKNIVASRCGVA
jgi:FkbM family methyltransferase